jgi:hypothetical protein
MEQNQPGHHQEEEDYALITLVRKWTASFRFLLGFWKVIAMAGIIGLILGLVVAWYKPVTYTANLSFVVEESKQGGGSLVSALAGQFGFDVGSMGGSSGMLAGDNVLELLKSKSLIKKTLLTPFKDSSNFSMADQYIIANDLKEKWKNSSKVGRDISFPSDKVTYSRLEDSLLQSVIKKISEDELSISKPDKKLNFFDIAYTNRDEKLGQQLCQRLLNITTDFYIETKTRRIRHNIERLQERADSLGNLLDKKTYSAARATQGLIDINPSYTTEAVSAEISSRNKFIQSTVYGEIVKNLEVSKTALIQETPTFQIVDYPELPLKRNRLGYLFAAFFGTLIGSVIMAVYLRLQKK